MAVKTIVFTGTTVIAQAPSPLSYTYKSDANGKMSVEIAMGAMSMMKQVVGDKEGYASQQGQKKVMDAAKFAESKASAVPFEELQMRNNAAITVTGIEPINGADAYAIQNGKATYFYDVKSGMKVAQSETLEQGGQKMTQITYLKDYRDVKGVKVPFNTILNVGIELDIKIDAVKINEGVSDADFQ